MTRLRHSHAELFLLCWLSVLVGIPGNVAAEPTSAALAGFTRYAGGVELRLSEQHRNGGGFLAGAAAGEQGRARLRQGGVVVEQMSPAEPVVLTGAMLHHWRGSAFAPGVHAADFERLMRDFGNYPRYFAPEVVQAGVLSQDGNELQASMRVRQRHVLSVVMDTAFDIRFGRMDGEHGYSVSRSTRISEIDRPGTSQEHAMTASEEHGFLWRLNTYWSYEERHGGLYVQMETVSLTRSIPAGLGWAVRPYVESVPRESLEFTLRAVCGGLRGGR